MNGFLLNFLEEWGSRPMRSNGEDELDEGIRIDSILVVMRILSWIILDHFPGFFSIMK